MDFGLEPENNLYDSNVISKLKMLRQSHQIVSKLDLSFNKLKGRCLKHLLALESLQILNVSENQIKIEEDLESSSIIELDLSNNNIESEDVLVLCEFLKENKTLAKLNLSNNQIEIGGAQALAEALLENKTLTTLILNDANITDTGSIELAQSLVSNNSLKHISLKGNSIKDTGAKAFAIALSVNTSLQFLDLSFNRLTTDGIQTLQDSVQKKEVDFKKMLKITYLNKSPKRFEKLFGHTGMGHGINVYPFLSRADINALGLVSKKLNETSMKYKKFQLFL